MPSKFISWHDSFLPNCKAHRSHKVDALHWPGTAIRSADFFLEYDGCQTLCTGLLLNSLMWLKLPRSNNKLIHLGKKKGSKELVAKLLGNQI